MPKYLDEPGLTRFYDNISDRPVNAFNTVADMQAATYLEEGVTCHTNGFHAAGDGGAAYYTVSASGTADGTNVIACAGGLYAHFISTTGLVSIDSYAGETNEDKLYAALDSVTSGTILCGNVTITKVYNALAKDYRNITIQGATFNLTIDEWFNQASSTFKSVVQFESCVINGNGHTIFSGQNNAIGMRFNGCTLNNVTAFSSASKYVQSPYFNGCTMFNLGNLITATIAYDFKMVDCRVEAAASGILFSFTDSAAIRQGVVSNCLIEGRGDVVFSVGGMYAFTIENCYFEALNGGLLVQNGSSVASFLRVFDCAFFGTMANTDYAITLNSSTFGFAKIRENVTDFPSGKYLCNRYVSFATKVGTSNLNYSSAFANDGFPTSHNRVIPVQSSYKTDAVWDADNSAWKVKFMLDYEEAYQGLHPIYVVFQASYGSAAQYAGFAIVRLTPRTAWNGSAIVTVCDATLVDSCNSNSMTKASSVSVSVDLSANGAGNPNIVYTLSIKGFNNLKIPRYRVIDPWYFVGAYNMSAE